MEKAFTAVGAFLADFFKLDRPGKGNEVLVQEIVSLSAGSRTAVRNYYAKKLGLSFGVLAAGLLLSVICFFFFPGEDSREEVQTLIRPGYGEADRREELVVQAEGQEEEQVIEVKVHSRVYTDQEKQEFLDRALAELETRIPGENDSLDEVRKDLFLPESLMEDNVKISWVTVPYGVVDGQGRLVGADNENGILVKLQGILECGGQKAEYTAYANVFPRELDEEEKFWRSVQKEAELADADGSHEESMQLPKSVEGTSLTWKRTSENPFLTVFAFTLIFAVCIYLEMDSRVHKRAEDRKKQLLLDYPDLMWKMTMLLGAGLGIRAAFARISEEYVRERSGKNSAHRKAHMRYVYEEVTYTCYEMQSGISESQAYERFGKRCQLPEYIRLGTVLSQNLKKGSRGLTKLLEEEAEASFTERRNHAKKLGEQAGTRLLLPMVLMLGVVLAVLMVPAFLAF